jgi:hypothetical protein
MKLYRLTLTFVRVKGVHMPIADTTELRGSPG